MSHNMHHMCLMPLPIDAKVKEHHSSRPTHSVITSCTSQDGMGCDGIGWGVVWISVNGGSVGHFGDVAVREAR